LDYHNQARKPRSNPAKAAQAIIPIVNTEIERTLQMSLNSSAC
jgi:hypothetical protein